MHHERMGWKVLLGENGTGKSSVLKAVALALAGEQQLQQYRTDPRGVLRRWVENGEVKEADDGFVRLHLSQGDPIELTFTKSGFQFKSGAAGMSGLLRGYGAMRLLPPKEEKTANQFQAKDLSNLFDPRKWLLAADEWMKARPANEFGAVALALKDLLAMDPEQEEIKPEDGEIWVYMKGTRVLLDELSDGYQSVLGLGLDIMSGVKEQLFDYQRAAGIVLIDEIGTHLHPRWRMAFVESLRNAFSHVQFLVTTHEPLCLIGLREHEIALLQRQGRDIEVVDTGLPNPEGMRADQILTSPLFGLNSTIHPAIDRKFQKYYALLAADNLTPDQQTERDQLRTELQEYRVLGYTRRDQLVYEAIDQYLADQTKPGNLQNSAQLKEETKQRIRDIWRRVGSQGGPL